MTLQRFFVYKHSGEYAEMVYLFTGQISSEKLVSILNPFVVFNKFSFKNPPQSPNQASETSKCEGTEWPTPVA